MCETVVLKKICKSYDDNKVLNNLNFSISRGEVVAIIGKSGSGKSTLLNIIGCIESFDSGKYFFDGKKIKADKDYSSLRLNNVGFIYQNYNLIPKLTCVENILLPVIYVKEKKDMEYFNELIDWLDIREIVDRDINLLSGGEKQRVAIARALILKPNLLIADEPTGNLDKASRDKVLSVLKEYVCIHNASLLIVTHDDEILSFADKTYLLESGRLYDR